MTENEQKLWQAYGLVAAAVRLDNGQALELLKLVRRRDLVDVLYAVLLQAGLLSSAINQPADRILEALRVDLANVIDPAGESSNTFAAVANLADLERH